MKIKIMKERNEKEKKNEIIIERKKSEINNRNENNIISIENENISERK